MRAPRTRPRSFVAKVGGHCPTCGQGFDAGTRVAMDESGRRSHARKCPGTTTDTTPTPKSPDSRAQYPIRAILATGPRHRTRVLTIDNAEGEAFQPACECGATAPDYLPEVKAAIDWIFAHWDAVGLGKEQP